MSKLINELVQEHKEIAGILNELKEMGATTTRGMELLMKSKTTLLNHLSKEDKQLYPPLNERAKSSLALQRSLETFGAEMDKITLFIQDFYKKYDVNKNINKAEFIRDVTKFFVTFKNRMMKEEVAIYKEYELLDLD